MKQMWFRACTVVGLGLSATAAMAQVPNWGDICVDPMNMMPRSNDFFVQTLVNDLMIFRMGVSGTVTYGGTNGPCFAPTARTIPIAGKFALSVGQRGSIQRSSQTFVDDFMAITFGAFQDPVWTYATVTKEGNRTRFGSAGIGTTFVGFSNRYMYADTVLDNVQTRLRVDVLADAVKFRWQLTNLDTEEANIGLWFGGAIGFFAQQPSSTGDIFSGIGVVASKPAYVFMPNQRPPRTDTMYDRTLNPAAFPDYVDIVFGQTDAFGIRLENTPSESTADTEPTNAPAEAGQFWVGKNTFLLGGIDDAGANFPVAMLPDTQFLGDMAFVQAFPERLVGAGATTQFLHYVRSTWGTGDYKLPYAAVVDAPRLIGTPVTDVNGNPTNGNIAPNPFQMRVYVDNVGGYANLGDNTEVPLNDVRIRLKFPANSGITITGASNSVPHELERTIPVVQPKDDEFVDYTVNLGPNVTGLQTYQVEIFSQPGNVRKTINGTIMVASRPRVTLVQDANLMTFPHQYDDTALETILANFLDPVVPGGDFQAYRYDPIQQGYVIANSVERGRGVWVIYNNTGKTNEIANLAGNPRLNGNLLNGSDLIQTRSGFNIIGNPYNYPVPVSQLVGVSASNPQFSRSFRELVELGFVQSFLTYWDPVTKDYHFVDSQTGLLEPNRGYWLRVLTTDDLTVSYPPVYAEFTPEQNRRAVKSNEWVQNDRQWKLKLTARTQDGMDSENHVGQASSAQQARMMRIFEPPMAPNQVVSLAVEGTDNGAPTRMAQTLSESTGRHEWKLVVEARKAGDVTITWPNISTLPKNLRFRIEDKAANISRFLRQSSGYTFRMNEPGTRELILTAEQGGAVGTVISNVVVSQPSRSTNRNSPFTISYTLATEATTSVRILSATGKEVFVASRGRADRAGENTIVWNLRNSANQAVAPGAYRVELVAETASGERIRKVIPINVIR